MGKPTIGDTGVIKRGDFQSLLDGVRSLGYRLTGPTVVDGAVVLDEIAQVSQLPQGVGDEQAGGHYRLTERGDEALFGYTTSAQSWKRFLHPPEARLWKAKRTEDGFEVVKETEQSLPWAFLGVRPCELAAIAIQDKVFDNSDYVDPIYNGRRGRALLITVNCGQVAATCFCSSMGSGPKARGRFDLALTEMGDRFLVEVGSLKGAALLEKVPHAPATPEDMKEANAVTQATEGALKKSMDPDHRTLLADNREHAHWENVAQRCLSCGNCTMVCPTCFCTNVEDLTSLDGAEAERVRKWDSCFTVDFSYIHGGSIRIGTASRYRQWISHKLTSWYEQFGSSGCVGCGRCITWCPVGIDITEEVAALKETKEKSDG